MPRFYRIVLADPPSLDDFTSYAALGRPSPAGATPELLKSWQAVSVFDTEVAARAMALRRGGRLGRFLAFLEVPEAGPIHYARSGANPRHFDLRGSPEDLLACVVAVVPV